MTRRVYLNRSPLSPAVIPPAAPPAHSRESHSGSRGAGSSKEGTMRGKIVLAVLLCLATALGIGAAPALAADGCTCHTAEPPTATAAHAPLVAAVTDCTTCHTAWTVPHPVAGSPWHQLSGRTVEAGYQLEAWVGVRKLILPAMKLVSVGHPDVVVYLQQRLWGATEFTDLTQVTTGSDGKYSFTVPSPVPFAAYRGISQGHVGALVGGGAALFEPGERVLLPKAVAKLKLLGLRNGAVKLGRSVRASGTVKPADIGGNVHFVVQKRQSGGWHTRPLLGGKAAISATGTYSWKFTPKSRGLFRVQASTDQHSETTRWGTSPWRQVVIK